MNINLIFTNLLNPPILFFFLGMCATFLRIDLVIPNPLAKFLSLYLLFAIGFHGGVELRAAGIGFSTFLPLIACVFSAILVPIYTFFILRKKVNVYNAAAIAATYGSVSAVTFITATSLLQNTGIDYGGHMVAALALMESPAIIVGLILVKKYAHNRESVDEEPSLFREAFLNSSVFLILGSLFIGFITGQKGMQSLQPFTHDIFKGMLSLFMLDMGLVAAKRMGDLKKAKVFLTLFAIVMPLVNALLAIIISHFIGLSVGDTLLFAVLSASASYIAVPAALRLSVPEASPGLYIPMALGITFPFNVLIGLPLYLYVIQLLG